MPVDSLERAERWRSRHLEMGRVVGQRFLRGAVETGAPEPSEYLDGVDDGWKAAYEALRAFAAEHGVERFGPALVGLCGLMPFDALMRVPPGVGAAQSIDDAWEWLVREHGRLAGESNVSDFNLSEMRGAD